MVIQEMARKRGRPRKNNKKEAAFFYEDEFIDGFAIESLCQAVNKDFPGIKLERPFNTIAMLNEVLQTPDFARRWFQVKRNKVEVSQYTESIIRKSKDIIKKKLSAIELSHDSVASKKIRKINRLLLEETYPELCPKHEKPKGRHKRDLFDSLRFKLMYDWVRKNYAQYSDDEIATKMLDIYPPVYIGDIGIFKGWLWSASNAEIADIGRPKNKKKQRPSKVWYLGYALAVFQSDNEHRSVHNPFAFDSFRNILMILTTKLHALVSESFVRKGYGHSTNDFRLVGHDFYSSLLPKSNNDYLSPRRGLRHLDSTDIALDVLEVLNDGKETDGSPLEANISQFLAQAESIIRDYVDWVLNTTFLSFKLIPTAENKLRHNLSTLKTQLHPTAIRNYLTIKLMVADDIKRYNEFNKIQPLIWVDNNTEHISHSLIKNNKCGLMKLSGLRSKSMKCSNIEYFVAIELTFGKTISGPTEQSVDYMDAVKSTLKLINQYYVLQTWDGPGYCSNRNIIYAISDSDQCISVLALDISEEDSAEKSVHIASLYDRWHEVQQTIENKYREVLPIALLKEKGQASIINDENVIEDAVFIIRTWLMECYEPEIIDSTIIR